MKLTYFSVLNCVYTRSTLYDQHCGDDGLSCLMSKVLKKLVKNLNIFDLIDNFGRLRQRRKPLFD